LALALALEQQQQMAVQVVLQATMETPAAEVSPVVEAEQERNWKSTEKLNNESQNTSF
jgi:hypothetical protein